MNSIQDFMKLSKLLTGIDTLDASVGDDYRRQLERTPGLGLSELLATYRDVAAGAQPLDELMKRLGNDQAGQRLRFAAQQIVRIWYLSEYVDVNGTLSGAGHFLDSALYQVLEAHPPAFSDRPHGYWAKPPHSSGEARP